jgi:hypothetical protein
MAGAGITTSLYGKRNFCDSIDDELDRCRGGFAYATLPQQCLYFFPLPQGQGRFRPPGGSVIFA